MNELYIPPHVKNLTDVSTLPQIRLGIQGFPGTGKTWAALTFPNPIVLNMNRGLGAHIGRNIYELPFYDAAFCKKYEPNYKPHMLHEVVIKWLETEGLKLSTNQTLIVDGNGDIQKSYHMWFEENKFSFLTKDGKVDGFAEYKMKIKIFNEITTLLKSTLAHVVYITHETEASVGKHAGKIRPLLTGAAGDDIVGEFTDWFRQLAMEKPKIEDMTPDKLKLWGMSKQEFQAFMDSFPRNAIYFWKTEGDNNFDGKCSSLETYPTFMPATYESFVKYRRKISPAT